jgi:anaerobic ribonucleoside-triphosphate reductase
MKNIYSGPRVFAGPRQPVLSGLLCPKYAAGMRGKLLRRQDQRPVTVRRFLKRLLEARRCSGDLVESHEAVDWQTRNGDITYEKHALAVSRAPETEALDQLARGAFAVLTLNLAYPRIGMQPNGDRDRVARP